MILYNLIKHVVNGIELIGTPARISSGCSKSIKIEIEDIELIKKVIKENKIIIKGIYHVTVNNGKKDYVKLKS